ncbi:MAG TPA: hypothetical protein VF242_12400 [Nitrososphaeraceae archaeon]
MPIEDALKQALTSLPKLKDGIDPNLADICHIAQTIKDFFNLQFNNKKFSKEEVVEIVEIVEEKLLRPVTIRLVYRDNIRLGNDALRVKSAEQILDEFKAIVNEISKRQLDFGSFEEIITKALFFWYGCLCMDKTCRKGDIEGNPIKYKLEIHDYLKNNSNPWIYYGFVSASKFRMTPDQLQIKDYSWIPKDSPYWKGDI